MRKAHIVDGIVENIIEVDPSSIPDWCAKWPEATDDCGIGCSWDGLAFTAPPISIEQAALNVRSKRDGLLRSVVDSIAGNVLRWNSLHPLKQEELSSYRLALLDIPQQVGFPLSVVWPPIPTI